VTRHERIEINPEIMGGKPVIRGTRVPVEIILRKLGAGMTPEAIITDHPRPRAGGHSRRPVLRRGLLGR
jgi:uncharacterized protein (DUF433 family)